MSEATPAPQTLLRGAMLKCPRCGEGRLFRAYLKRQDACPHCGESFDGLDADDGPAWLTIALVAHIVVPLLIFLERGDQLMPYWQEAAILVFATIAGVLLLLPVSKGFFIAALWLIRSRG